MATNDSKFELFGVATIWEIRTEQPPRSATRHSARKHQEGQCFLVGYLVSKNSCAAYVQVGVQGAADGPHGRPIWLG